MASGPRRFFLMFNTWGLVNSYGAFQTHYQTELLRSTSASNISWIGSIQTFLLLFGSLVVGPIVDRGHLKLVLWLGSFLVVFGMMMASLCHEYWQMILTRGLVVGLGFACLFVPSVAIIPLYFQKRRALALGIASSGSSVGAIIYTITFQQLQPRISFGWTTLADPPNRTPVKFDSTVWKDKGFALVTFASFFGFVGMYIPFFYIELYALSQHALTGSLNAYLLPLLNVGSLVGRLLPPFLADKVGPLNSIVVSTLGATVLGFAWIGVTSAAEIVVFALLFGFFSGAFVALGTAVVAALTPDLRVLGLRIGLFSVPGSIGLLIGNPIAGSLLKGGWLPLQAFCGTALVLCWVFLVVTRLSKTGLGLFVKA